MAPRIIRFRPLFAWLFFASISLIAPVPGSEIDTASPLLIGDSDQDGMPDLWEIVHGLDPNDPDDALEDPDGDGSSNRNEYLAGTNPHSAVSVLRFTKIKQIASNVFFLQFKATSNRAYSVVFRTDNQSVGWIKIRDFEAASTNRLIELTNTVPPDMAAQRFYNVVTSPPR